MKKQSNKYPPFSKRKPKKTEPFKNNNSKIIQDDDLDIEEDKPLYSKKSKRTHNEMIKNAYQDSNQLNKDNNNIPFFSKKPKGYNIKTSIIELNSIENNNFQSKPNFLIDVDNPFKGKHCLKRSPVKKEISNILYNEVSDNSISDIENESRYFIKSKKDKDEVKNINKNLNNNTENIKNIENIKENEHDLYIPNKDLLKNNPSEIKQLRKDLLQIHSKKPINKSQSEKTIISQYKFHREGLLNDNIRLKLFLIHDAVTNNFKNKNQYVDLDELSHDTGDTVDIMLDVAILLNEFFPKYFEYWKSKLIFKSKIKFPKLNDIIKIEQENTKNHQIDYNKIIYSNNYNEYRSSIYYWFSLNKYIRKRSYSVGNPKKYNINNSFFHNINSCFNESFESRHSTVKKMYEKLNDSKIDIILKEHKKNKIKRNNKFSKEYELRSKSLPYKKKHRNIKDFIYIENKNKVNNFHDNKNNSSFKIISNSYFISDKNKDSTKEMLVKQKHLNDPKFPNNKKIIYTFNKYDSILIDTLKEKQKINSNIGIKKENIKNEDSEEEIDLEIKKEKESQCIKEEQKKESNNNENNSDQLDLKNDTEIKHNNINENVDSEGEAEFNSGINIVDQIKNGKYYRIEVLKTVGNYNKYLIDPDKLVEYKYPLKNYEIDNYIDLYKKRHADYLFLWNFNFKMKYNEEYYKKIESDKFKKRYINPTNSFYTFLYKDYPLREIKAEYNEIIRIKGLIFTILFKNSTKPNNKRNFDYILYMKFKRGSRISKNSFPNINYGFVNFEQNEITEIKNHKKIYITHNEDGTFPQN